MSNEPRAWSDEELADGWYHLQRDNDIEYVEVADNFVWATVRASVHSYLSNGWTLTPAVVLTKAQYDALVAQAQQGEWEDVPNDTDAHSSTNARWSVCDDGEIAVVYPAVGVRAPLPDGWRIMQRRVVTESAQEEE